MQTERFYRDLYCRGRETVRNDRSVQDITADGAPDEIDSASALLVGDRAAGGAVRPAVQVVRRRGIDRVGDHVHGQWTVVHVQGNRDDGSRERCADRAGRGRVQVHVVWPPTPGRAASVPGHVVRLAPAVRRARVLHRRIMDPVAVVHGIRGLVC